MHCTARYINRISGATGASLHALSTDTVIESDPSGRTAIAIGELYTKFISRRRQIYVSPIRIAHGESVVSRADVRYDDGQSERTRFCATKVRRDVRARNISISYHVTDLSAFSFHAPVFQAKYIHRSICNGGDDIALL